MRLGCFAVAASAVMSAQLAQAVPRILLPPAPDLAGKNSGKELTRAVNQALATAHVRVATPYELSRIAAGAQVKLKGGLSIDQAAKLATRADSAGVVLFRKASRGAFAQLVDAHGQVTLERLLHVKKGAASEVDAAAFASAVAQALEPPSAAVSPAPPASALGDMAAAPTAPVPPPPPAPPSSPRNRQRSMSALAGPEPVATHSTEPAAGYFFRLGLFAGPAERRFLAPGYSYVTGYPYAAGGVSLELFPFRAFGLGFVGDFAFGRVADQLAEGGSLLQLE